jgi:hypothetical protein
MLDPGRWLGDLALTRCKELIPDGPQRKLCGVLQELTEDTFDVQVLESANSFTLLV